MSYQRVARLDEFPAGSGLAARIGEIEVGLFRVGDEVYAMENRCPHADSPLSEGLLEGCVITCSAHGWDFDVRTGYKPGDADGFPIPCFAVEVRGEEVWVDLDRIENRPQRKRRPLL